MILPSRAEIDQHEPAQICPIQRKTPEDPENRQRERIQSTPAPLYAEHFSCP